MPSTNNLYQQKIMENLIENVLKRQFPYVRKQDGIFTYCAKGNENLTGDGIFLTINTKMDPDEIFIYSSLAHSLSEPQLATIREHCDDDDCIDTEFGTLQIMDDTLAWVISFVKESLLSVDNPEDFLTQLLTDLLGVLTEQLEWAQENILGV